MHRIALSTRTVTETLPAQAGAALEWRTLLNAESQAATWRVVEIVSTNGMPADVRVTWSASGSSGSWVMATLSRGTQLRIYARTVKVEVANLSQQKENTINLAVHDGLLPQTDNVWESVNDYDGITGVLVAVPPFASAVQVMLDDPSLLSTTEVTLRGDDGSALAKYLADYMGWIPVGSTHVVLVIPPSAATVRVIFKLTT